MKTERIYAENEHDLEDMVAAKESQGWKREGDPESFGRVPDKNGVIWIVWTQTVTRENDEIV